jgi:hypothetical protein
MRRVLARMQQEAGKTWLWAIPVVAGMVVYFLVKYLTHFTGTGGGGGF